MGLLLSIDPLQFDYPHYTPYQYAGNKPISYIDLDGLEEYDPNNIVDRTLNLTNIHLGISIESNKSDGSSKLLKSEAIIKESNNYSATFYTIQTSFSINKDGEVININEERRKWQVYRTDKGQIFSEGNEIKGYEVSHYVREMKNLKPVKFNEWQKDEALEYVNSNEPVIKEWINLTKERPDLIIDGRAPYNKLLSKNIVIDFLIDVVEVFLGTYGNSPININIPDINQKENYFIPQSELDKAPNRIKESKRKLRKTKVIEA